MVNMYGYGEDANEGEIKAHSSKIEEKDLNREENEAESDESVNGERWRGG